MTQRAIVSFDDAGEVLEYELGSKAERSNRCWRAMMLSGSLEVCKALLDGEYVPLERLNQDWVAKFGRRTR